MNIPIPEPDTIILKYYNLTFLSGDMGHPLRAWYLCGSGTETIPVSCLRILFVVC